jgi:protein-tyrosine kinase
MNSRNPPNLARPARPSLVERAARCLPSIAEPPVEIPAPRPAEAQPEARRRQPAVTIDLDELQRRGIVTPRGERTHIGEEFRQIKRPLLQQAFAPEPGGVRKNNLIMVTSSMPDEGKTFTAVNLAMSMAAERDVHVVLVDADLSRPGLASALRITTGRGLSDLLEDASLDIANVLLRTNLPNLALIPSGPRHLLATELLASQRAAGLIRELAVRYTNRVVIFDTAPTLSSSEGGSLAQFVGQVVLVVEAERTSDTDLKRSLDLLSGCGNVQLLLNKARTRLGAGRLSDYFAATPEPKLPA